MIVYCTYCSARKDNNEDPIPAIERYLSSRISDVAQMAKSDDKDFFILSGKFGLLKSSDEIPFYDHLLIAEETAKHAELIAQQLKNAGISEIHYFTRSAESDSNVVPYMICLQKAAEQCGVELGVNIETF